MSVETVYLIVYDLNNEKNYRKAKNALVEKIQEISSDFCHPMRSVFLMKTGLNIGDVCEELENSIDSNDCLLITGLGKNSRSLFSPTENDSKEMKISKTIAQKWLNALRESKIDKPGKATKTLKSIDELLGNI